MEILLDHIVQPVIGFEDPVKNPAHLSYDEKQAAGQQGHHHTIDEAQPGADAQSHGEGQNQHHTAADGHADDHLECILQVGHVGGQAGYDGGRGKLVNVGKGIGLHFIEYILPQVFGEAGRCPGGKGGRQYAKAQ